MTRTSSGRARAILSVALLTLWSQIALADEGGISFWVPGLFGSFAATPGEAGLTLPVVYYHMSADASGSKEFPRGRKITVGIDAKADLLFLFPTYVFAEPVLGAHAAVGLGVAFGRAESSADATLTGPRGNVLSRNPSDSVSGVSDLYPQASLKWRDGRHNFMGYVMGGAPTGAYEAGRLANIGTNHWSVDAGGGYTYYNTDKGRELSGVLGFTYNFENPDTDYRNGVDAHFDWAASQFLSEHLQVGVVGYVYHQLTGDSGAGAKFGDFKSRVWALGPQLGYFFEVGNARWYANLKGYYEFDGDHRPDGWNVWLTLAIPLK